MTVHLATFSDESMSRAATLCRDSAFAHGVERWWYYIPENLRNYDLARASPEVFRQPEDPRRAWAWWAWKPWIVSLVLDQLHDGETLVYSDAGIEFINNVNYIIDRMGHEKPQDDIWLFGNNWEHAHWCKRDVIEAVWPLGASAWVRHCITRSLDTLADPYSVPTAVWERFGKQVQASVIFFRVSDYTRKFVAEWLKWCLFEGGRLIDDSPSRAPNHPQFQENRHDQSILTTLAYREGIKLHYWPAVYNKGGSPEFVYEKLPEYAGDDYPVLFSHHRKRNHEFQEEA